MSLKQATNNKCPRGIPSALAMEQEFCYEGVLASNYTFVNPSTSIGPYNGGRGTKISINLPQEMIDLRDSYLEFTVTASAGNTAGLTCSFVQDIRSIFSRMAISFGSQTVIDIQEYNRLQNIFDYMNMPQWYDYDGAVLVGADSSQAARQGYFTNANKKYACRLGFTKGIESIFYRILPLQKLATSLKIDLYLEDPANCISTSAAVTGTVPPSYTVNNVEFHYMTIVPTNSLDSRLNATIAKRDLTFTCRGFDSLIDSSIASSGSTSFSKILTYKYADFLGVVMAFVPSATVSSYTSDVKMKYFYNPNITALRLKVGGQYYPTDSTTVDSDVYGRYLEMFGQSTENVHTAALAWNYNGSAPATASYIPCCPVAKYPNEIYADGREVVPGLDTSIATSMQIDVQFGTALPANMTVYFWAIYNYTVVFEPNGSTTLYR